MTDTEINLVKHLENIIQHLTSLGYSEPEAEAYLQEVKSAHREETFNVLKNS